ncbi:MAG: AAA family ATPase [Eubacteriales bacterium]
MERDERYEINSQGELVVGIPVTLTPTERKTMIERLFNRNGWIYTLLQEISSVNYYINLKNNTLDLEYNIYLYHGNVRKEDPERSREEKKIQLGENVDPRINYDNGVILGFYVYENKMDVNDAIIVAWPIENEKNYPANVSLRVNTKRDILPAKNTGFHIDSTSGKNVVSFRPEFIYHYLSNYKEIHYSNAFITAEEEHGNQPIDSTTIIGENILLYGVPGSGKSNEIKTKYCDNEDLIERVVFHPDYTYSDFVGQILPQIKQEEESSKIEYKFIPGPFTRILKACNDDFKAGLNQHRYLIIEEINRGNAPAIFGEVFQLLDRCDSPLKGIVGESEYGISNSDIAVEVYGDANTKVRIPYNLTILATMNTADQNVFTLDTAFKRRWKMKAIRNKFVNDSHCNHPLCGTTLRWKDFAIKINEKIIEFGESNLGSEDNRLGVYFLKDNEMDDVSIFSEKILMYLWSDAFKYNRDDIFVNSYKNLEDLIDGFAEFKFEVFNEELGFGNIANNVITEIKQIGDETIEDEVDGE